MWTRILTAASLAMVLAAPAAAQPTQPTQQEIFRAVQRQVLSYPQFGVFDSVRVQISNGTVILTGKVTEPLKRKQLEERVSRVRGINKVENRIDVLPASRSDDELRQGIANAIYGNALFSRYANQTNPPIHIIVERGRVTLEGVVASALDRQVAYTIASMFGAFSVKNDLQTDEEALAELKKLQR